MSNPFLSFNENMEAAAKRAANSHRSIVEDPDEDESHDSSRLNLLTRTADAVIASPYDLNIYSSHSFGSFVPNLGSYIPPTGFPNPYALYRADPDDDAPEDPMGNANRKRKSQGSKPGTRQWRIVLEGLSKDNCLEYLKCHRWKMPVANAPKGAGCRVSQCALHVDCKHLLKMRLTDPDDMTKYTLEESGEHSEELVLECGLGLHDLIVGDVDALILNGMSPGEILNELRERYTVQKEFTLLSLLPDDRSKIKNRVLTLSKKYAKHGSKRSHDGTGEEAASSADDAETQDAVDEEMTVRISSIKDASDANGREYVGKLAKRMYVSQQWNRSENTNPEPEQEKDTHEPV